MLQRHVEVERSSQTMLSVQREDSHQIWVGILEEKYNWCIWILIVKCRWLMNSLQDVWVGKEDHIPLDLQCFKLLLNGPAFHIFWLSHNKHTRQILLKLVHNRKLRKFDIDNSDLQLDSGKD